MPDTNAKSEFRFTAYMVTGVVRDANLTEPNGEVLSGFLLATSRGDAEGHHIAWMAKVRPDHVVMWCRAIPIVEHDLLMMTSKIMEHQARAMAPAVPAVANDTPNEVPSRVN
jgi:hypothetical protein